MRYDDPKVIQIIDDCVKSILEEPDEVFLLRENDPAIWANVIRNKVSNALKDSDGFMKVATAVDLVFALNYYQSYIKEQASFIHREASKRHLIKQIEATAFLYGSQIISEPVGNKEQQARKGGVCQ